MNFSTLFFFTSLVFAGSRLLKAAGGDAIVEEIVATEKQITKPPSKFNQLFKSKSSSSIEHVSQALERSPKSAGQKAGTGQELSTKELMVRHQK